MPATKHIAKYDKELGKVVWYTEGEEKPQELHYIQEDTIPPTMSHATDEGKVFDSRQKLNEHYKANGFEATGGDHLSGKPAAPTRKHFECEEERSRKAEWGMLKVDPEMRACVQECKRRDDWGMAPISEIGRKICQKEESEYKKYKKSQG